jgi:hypothetical protein
VNEDVELTERIDRFRKAVQAPIAGAACFEDAARAFANALYSEFADFVVLARVFAVIPFRALPPADRDYVRASLGGRTPNVLGDATPVLTLFGTRGIEPHWNDRTLSRDHRAIALVSDAFVEEAPMIAKLFAEIDASPRGAADGDWQFVKKVADGDGLFFVGDARTMTDSRGRRVIPAEAFVERYGVRTVFGFGTHLPDTGTVIAVIVFCRKTLMRSLAYRFVQLIDTIQSGTRDSVARGVLFAVPQSNAESP